MKCIQVTDCAGSLSSTKVTFWSMGFYAVQELGNKCLSLFYMIYYLVCTKVGSKILHEQDTEHLHTR